MGYKLSKRSLSRLEGVDERLVTVVKYAMSVTKQDFSVICGLRTMDEQKALVAKGASHHSHYRFSGEWRGAITRCDCMCFRRKFRYDWNNLVSWVVGIRRCT